jgi:hypothetical protein
MFKAPTILKTLLRAAANLTCAHLHIKTAAQRRQASQLQQLKISEARQAFLILEQMSESADDPEFMRRVGKMTELVEDSGGLKRVGIPIDDWQRVTHTPYALTAHLIEGKAPKTRSARIFKLLR